MDSGAKSGVVLVLDEGSNDTFTAYMRYNKTEENVQNILDVICVVKSAMHGRDYVESYWLDIFVERGYATVETITTRKVKF